MRKPNYDILAVDLDGTLLGPTGKVSEANLDAVNAARKAGVEVIICTGRGLVESKIAMAAIRAHERMAGREDAPIVVAGGSMIADASTGRTLQRWPMNGDLVRRVVQRFRDANSASMVLKDPDAAGFDYLIVDTGPLDPVNVWWFEKMGVRRRHIPELHLDEHPEHTVRVGLAATTDRMFHLGQEIISEFEKEATLHHFAAVSSQNTGNGLIGKSTTVHLLEVFDKAVTKWTAIDWIAQKRGVPRERVAAIGDEINDVAMLAGAGLGIAMGNAISKVKDVADKHVASHEDDGVAQAIDAILSGKW
jgi:hydroxymethylpyrimidine pyrophosphatase-like HAD family hydrolase